MTQSGRYMNGGVAGHAMGELARGAYENGFEDYASDIMNRMLDLAKQYGNRLWFAYTDPSLLVPPLRITNPWIFLLRPTWTSAIKGVPACSRGWTPGNRLATICADSPPGVMYFMG